MELIKKYFPGLTETQLSQFAQLEPLYNDWNSKINVISRKDMEHFYLHHVLHSLAIAKTFTFTPGMRILDVGTGGGFRAFRWPFYFRKQILRLSIPSEKKLLSSKKWHRPSD